MLFKIVPQRGFRKLCPIFLNSVQKISTEENDVLIKDIGDKGVIILNRPQAMNSLNLSMGNKIYSALLKWKKEKKTLVLVKGNGGKAFCAGGDIKVIAEAASKGHELRYNLYRSAYINNGVVGSLKIPYVTLLDGIVMGGSVGFAVLGRYQVTTEKTLFAVPETQIGMVPDAGSSYVLSRLGGPLGLFIGLTGVRLKGADISKIGIASHFTDSANIPRIEEALLQCSNDNDIKNTLNKFQKEDKSEWSLAPYMEKINYCFSAPTVEEIYDRLEKDGSKWAEDTIKTLNKMSPTSLKITLKQLGLSRSMNLQECLEMEFRIIANRVDSHDFREGVRALLVDRNQNPKWQPATIKEVTDDIVDSHFRKLPGELDSKYIL